MVSGHIAIWRGIKGGGWTWGLVEVKLLEAADGCFCAKGPAPSAILYLGLSTCEPLLLLWNLPSHYCCMGYKVSSS